MFGGLQRAVERFCAASNPAPGRQAAPLGRGVPTSASLASDERSGPWLGLGGSPRRGRRLLAAGAARTVVWRGGKGCARECDAGLGRALRLLAGGLVR